MEKSSDNRVQKKQGIFRRSFKEVKKNNLLYLMALPAVIYVIILAYIPMGGLIIAFKDYKYNLGILGSPWVGMRNFLTL